MATFSDNIKKVSEILNPYIHPSIKEGIHHLNLKAVRNISLCLGILETVFLFYYFIFSPDILRIPSVLWNVIYSIVVCLCTLFITNHALKKSKKPYSFYRYICIAYFLLMLAFGMFTSFYHYCIGDQILVFFATVFCLVNFVILPPYQSIVLIPGSYIVFYAILYFHDGAATINIVNYILLALLTSAGSIHKYHMQATELERIHRIETMNEMLQNVPVHDNLTDLKNRYALRDDFNSYQNHHIIVIMLDIDEFSKVNDSHGTAAGDIILSDIASLIKKHLTDSHSYRYGADSFLIILQDIEVDVAMQRLSAWEKSMAMLTVPGTDIPVHCTSGYSHGTPRDEEDLRLLIEAADKKRRDFT